MVEQQNGVSPATAGGAPAPEDAFQRKVFVAAEDLANIIGCGVINLRGVANFLHAIIGDDDCNMAHVTAEHVFEMLRNVEGHAEKLQAQINQAAPEQKPLPPFKLRPVLGGPELNMTGDEDGNMWPESVGWALSWGCQLTFGRDEETAEPYVQVSLSDEDLRRGITQRKATRAQVAAFARMLAEQFGEPAGADPRDAEIKRLRLEVALARSIADKKRAVAEKLRGQADDAHAERDDLAERLEAVRPVRDAFRKQLKELDQARAEVTRLKRLVGDEHVPDGWADKDRHEAIVRAEESYAEWLKMRDENTALVAERDRLRAELDRIAEQRPPFQPGQRVRVGNCMGTVHKPLHDTTFITLDGAGQVAEFSTRNVVAVPVCKPAEPRRLCGAGNEDYSELSCTLPSGHTGSHQDRAQGATWPAEPRRWVAGDPEPEIGTTVSTGKYTYTRGDDGSWHRDGDQSGNYAWEHLTYYANAFPLVEVVSTDG